MLLVLLNVLSVLNNMRTSLIFGVIIALLPLCSVAADATGGVASVATPEAAKAGVFTFASVMQLIFGLFLVLLMILASAWLVKRFGRWQGGYTDHLKVVGGLAIGARERIVLVQIGEQQILIGVTPGTIRTLHVLDEPVPVEVNGSVSEPLAEKFATLLKKQRNQ